MRSHEAIIASIFFLIGTLPFRERAAASPSDRTLHSPLELNVQKVGQTNLSKAIKTKRLQCLHLAPRLSAL